MQAEIGVGALTRSVRTVRGALRDASLEQSVIGLSAEGGQLTFGATGRSMSITCRADAVVTESGGAVLPARLFGDIVARGASEVARLSVAGLDLSIVAGDLTASLRLLAFDAPRPLELVGSEEQSQLSADEAARCAAISVAASSDPQRPVLTGIHLCPGVAEATDGYRIARTSLANWRSDVVVPADLVRLVASAGADLSVAFDGRLVRISSIDATWTSPTIASPYPSLDRFFETAVVETVHADRLSLVRAAELAGLIAGAPLELRGCNSGLTVISESVEVGKVETTIAATVRAGFHAMFGATYFRDAVQLATCNEISLHVSERQAVVACDAYTQLIMKRASSD